MQLHGNVDLISKHQIIESSCVKSIANKKENISIPENSIAVVNEIVFDRDFYKSHYADLVNFADYELDSHWKEYGFGEGRFGSKKHCQQSIWILEDGLDIFFYMERYVDIKEVALGDFQIALEHYKHHGKKEKRQKNFHDMLNSKGVPGNIFCDLVFINEILDIQYNVNLGVSLGDVLDLLDGKNVSPIMLDIDKDKNIERHKLLIEYFLSQGTPQAALRVASSSMYFGDNIETRKVIADIYFSQGLYGKSLLVYSTINEPNSMLQAAISACFLKDIETSMLYAKKLIPFAVEHGFIENGIKRICQELWGIFINSTDALCDACMRGLLFEKTKIFAMMLYDLYLDFYKNNNVFRPINTNKILIIGDESLSQCVRYRISQKIEQLTRSGFTARFFGIQDLCKSSPIELVSYDIVIFYRVIAIPEVIKAIAQVNARGALSIYEIDDLLFEQEYPSGVDSYGGFVDYETYKNLMRGAALFYAAAKLCKVGLASTLPLTEKLARVVQFNHVELHRNGIDKQNIYRDWYAPKPDRVVLFYGSGTKAHNSDFVDIFLKVIVKLLDSYESVSVMLVGYSSLPKYLEIKYYERIKRFDFLEDYQGYLSLLEKADINLAILFENEINDCKSEIKWLEASCLSIPSVVSGTKNYRDVIQHKKTGFIAENVEDWIAYLSLLIEDEVLREKVGKRAYEYVMESYDIDALGSNFMDIVNRFSQCYYPQKVKMSTKKKIALVNVFFPPQSYGGATRVVEDNFLELLANYADIYDFCIFTSHASEIVPHTLEIYHYHGIPVYRAGIIFRENMDWHAEDPEMYSVFNEFLDAEQPDLIHFHCIQRLTATIVEAAIHRSIKYIVTIHDAWWISDFQFLCAPDGTVYPDGHPCENSFISAFPEGISRSTSEFRRVKLKNILKSARAVLSVSKTFEKIYKKNGIDQNIYTIRNGISDRMEWRDKNTSYSSKVVCAHVGGLARHKGYNLLKDVLENIETSNIEFIFVDLSKQKGYSKKIRYGNTPVEYIGGFCQQEVVELYTKIDVLFAPSIWPESFGLVTREAAACGCWIIASNLGGIGEDVIEGETGHVISPNKQDLKRIIFQIDQNNTKYKAVAKTKSIHGAQQQVKELSELYNKFLNE